MGSTDLDFIIQGLKWLSENLCMREGNDKSTQKDAATYAERQLRVVRRILDYVASQDDAIVMILRKLLEIKLNQNIRDLAMIAIMSKRPIETFSRYEQLLITKNIFGEGSHWL